MTTELEVVGKPIGRLRAALIGMGAANVATDRILEAGGAINAP